MYYSGKFEIILCSAKRFIQISEFIWQSSVMDFHLYDYRLPTDRIALEPVSPRDSAKLMVYDTATDAVTIDTFAHLDRYLPVESVIVLNETKVVPSKIMLKKERGRDTEILFLWNEPQANEGLYKVISSRHLPVGQELRFDDQHVFTIECQDERFFYLRPHFSAKELEKLMHQHGHMPLPHYLQSTALDEKSLRRKYQTVFAEVPGSVAAPTASLHFTSGLLKRLEKGHELLKITHHVGLATFTPVLPENVEAKKLFEEWYDIDAGVTKKLKDAKSKKRPIIAVGTTATRALESFFCSSERKGSTDLFIFPPYEFRAIDGLVTNFHLPKTSLMMLVEAFLQFKNAKRNLKQLYEIAIRENFRFYSFGDGMVVV